MEVTQEARGGRVLYSKSGYSRPDSRRVPGGFPWGKSHRRTLWSVSGGFRPVVTVPALGRSQRRGTRLDEEV